MKRLGLKSHLFNCVGMKVNNANEYLESVNVSIRNIKKITSPRQAEMQINDDWRVIAIDEIERNVVDIYICMPLGK